MKHRVMRAELRSWVATQSIGCTAEWDSADPLFVRLTFAQAGRSVTWDVPREGLLTGMELREGGDLGIVRDLAHDSVVITFIGEVGDQPKARIEVSLAAPALDSWLEETDHVVPVGSELRDVDWNLLAFQIQPDASAEGEFRDASGEVGECRVCAPERESIKYLDAVNAPACPLCGRKLR